MPVLLDQWTQVCEVEGTLSGAPGAGSAVLHFSCRLCERMQNWPETQLGMLQDRLVPQQEWMLG